MKTILLIATGGTIATKMTEDGLCPLLTSDEILTCVPEVSKKCKVDSVQLFNLDSTNIRHNHWCEIAGCIRDNYGKYDGFVITHGTDTMAYTAAALSYLVQQSPKPIVITGSQKSICNQETDARINLRDAFYYAVDERACGVHLVFDGKVILGTRARKLRTKSYNAFSSIDFPEAAVIIDGQLIFFLEEKKEGMSPQFYDEVDPNVFVIKLIPGMKPDIFKYLKNEYHAVIIESFGVSGIPFYDDVDFMNAFEDWIQSGRIIVMTTQVQHEGSNMSIYEVGRKVKEKFELIEAYNMTLESVVTKLMWILAQTREPAEVSKLFYTPVQKDILCSFDEK